MSSVPDKTIVGADIYNLVVAAHNTAKLKRHIQSETTKSADDKHLRTLRQFLEQDILAVMGSRMAEQQPPCFSWPEYICKQPVTARDLLTPHVARFLAMMRSIEHQYVLMRRLCCMERKYSDTNAVTICEEPVLLGFSSFPEGIWGDRDDLDMVVVYNEDNWNALSAVERIDRLGYIDSRYKDQDKYGEVKNPAMYGMTGKNIKWAGIYHS
jgi:hypothetical protein